MVRCRDHMRHKPAANVQPIELVKLFVCPDCAELQDLIERRLDAGRFGVVEDIGRHIPAC
jgi:hypothetical protein